MLMGKGGLRLHSYKLQNKFGLLHVPIILKDESEKIKLFSISYF